MKARLALLLLGFAAACSEAKPIPADARKMVVSLTRLDCAECGDEIVTDLRSRPGVYQAEFDKQQAEIRVFASPNFDVFTAVRQLAAQKGFDATLGAGKGQYLEGPKFPEGADVQVVATDGTDVPDLASVLVKGKVTVVDFSAKWCKPCRQVDEHMINVLGVRPDVAYRKLDIGDWNTPLAKHYLKSVPQLPYVIVYDAAGAKVTSISGVDLGGLNAAITKGAPQH
jgi:thiol-disulfide isomerase/thioredoxin